MLNTVFNALTVRMRPSLEDRITEEMLFSMPVVNEGPAILLGATRATPFIVEEAIAAGHRKFVVVGGKPVGREDFMYTRFLAPKLEEAAFVLPDDPAMRECDYAAKVLMHDFGVKAQNITMFEEDTSANLQQNMEVLQLLGYSDNDAVEFFALAALPRRVIGTARKVWGNSDCVIAAHSCYPSGIDWTNWPQDFASAFYAVSEAEKVLSDSGKPSAYERKGYVVPVDIHEEIKRVEAYKAASRPSPSEPVLKRS